MPTSFKPNKFTQVFHSIVTNYGQPNYKEVNPAVIYLFQFPFTYAMMFGDVGHAFINFLVALMLIIFEKKLNLSNDMVELLHFGRYLILMMAAFSMLTGLIYNDVFSIPFNFFNSSYEPDLVHSTSQKMVYKFSQVYKFGIDPWWRWGDNSMQFNNSFKMKTSVVIGVS